ncbi:MAG: DNA methylase [Lachnospiraceae bacterium]|nr:DNA methylase [Lachnospiraceae bacterium]MBQ8947967.1 DNA methylase [Lachnospiraceae bacterium]
MDSRSYIAIDMKSFYASVECVARGLDPLTTNLLVADDSRSDQTICLAVSPSLKAIGVPGRPRLFEAKRAIADYEKRHPKVSYITAVPRMALYEQVSAQIYSIILKYAAPEEVHVYSIDESFIDATPYLGHYEAEALKQGVSPSHLMAMTIIRDVLKTTGITATVGIGTNIYLAKVAMDIVAKKAQPDSDGVRIAELDEESYCYRLWDHRPLTDFWMIGPGKARRMERANIRTLGEAAERSQWDEEWFYRTFGIDGEIMLSHVWGQDPVTMEDIKNYHSDSHSLSNGQVLPRPYKYAEARNVLSEMIDSLCGDMFAKNLTSPKFTWWVSYDYKSLEELPNYDGPVSVDFYGRLHPRHNNGTVRMPMDTNSESTVAPLILDSFDRKTDHRLLYRRLGVCAEGVHEDMGSYQMSLFIDYDALEKERHLQSAIIELRRRYGANSIFKGKNLLEGATQMERNMQIGGHKA